jgi:hypothetical protein
MTNKLKKEKVVRFSKEFSSELRKQNIPDSLKMEVKLAIDCSSSMREEYELGRVQNIIDSFIGSALRFDDNGKLEVCSFNYQCYNHPPATLDDVSVYLTNNKIHPYGSTSFLPIIEDFLLKKEKGIINRIKNVFKKKYPIFLTIITDGENDDKEEFIEILEDILDKSNVFIHIIGISENLNTTYLTFLENRFSNIYFSHFKDLSHLPPTILYYVLASSKLARWLKENKHI